MTQEDRWKTRYEELVGFIEANKRNPSKYVAEERLMVLCTEEGRYGVNIPKGMWHTIEAMEPNSCIFECKEGPFVPHDAEGILKV